MDRPIIYSTELIPKILDGSKTNTRRLNGLKRINESPDDWIQPYQLKDTPELWTFRNRKTGEVITIKCPYGQVGDRLWVRESFAHYFTNVEVLSYKASCDSPLPDGIRWRSPRFMFKRYARIWLEITNIRVERLQEITEEDAEAEGVSWSAVGNENYDTISAVANFAELWNSLNPKYSWESNPFVWVIEFKKGDCP